MPHAQIPNHAEFPLEGFSEFSQAVELNPLLFYIPHAQRFFA